MKYGKMQFQKDKIVVNNSYTCLSVCPIDY